MIAPLEVVRHVQRVRRLAILALLAAAAGAAGMPAGPARAAARLTRGPFVQDARDTGVALLWRTDTAVTGAVEFRPAAASADTSWLTIGKPEAVRSHEVALPGLQPGTAYAYRIRTGQDLIYEGGLFRTLPPPAADTLNFVVYGDNRTNHGPHADVVRRILREQPLPDVLVHTGDLVENGLRPDQWDVFFEIEHDLLARVPLFPALGNHEEDSPLFFDNFRVPSNGTPASRGRWYSFDAGPAHFVALDVVFSDVEPGTPQYRWLENDLRRTDRLWKFVYFHYPPYTASTPHLSSLRLRDALEQLFYETKVSTIYSGHAHVYERATGLGLPPPALLYIVSGGGGAPQHTVGRQPWTRYTEASYHFVRARIRGDRLTTVGVHADGSEFDPVEGRLNADGRFEVTSPIAAPVVVPQITAAQFLVSRPGVLLGGYALLFAVVLPVGLSAAMGHRRRRVVPVRSGPVPQPMAPLVDPHGDWRGLPALGVAAGVMAFIVVALLPGAPLRWIIGFDFYSITLTVHGVSGVVLLVVAAATANMGYRLAAHRAPSIPVLQGNALAALTLAATSATLGNVLYARYLRADGPKELLIRKAPEAHSILFEFKEFAGLVPLPLAVAATYVIWRYRRTLRLDRHLAEVIALLLLLLSAYCMLPLSLGAAITRIRGIA